MDDTCTHRSRPLSEGELNGNEVSCPWHGARFDVTSAQS
ncbi:MAG: Rieske (2Fe-2S) protein [Bryobacteraceae bacterium]